MLFNTLEFALFLPIVFLLYWLIPRPFVKAQNTLIVVASYIFYGWWDWRFLSLIFFSTIVDYFVGMALQRQENPRKRKHLLRVSLFVNLGFLGFFKYFNFFVDSFVDAFTLFGADLNITSLQIILPVGISFYTFQTLSYSIDVYKGKLKASSDFIAFSAYVSFFPQLVAGPIERATNLLPQFYTPRQFDYHNAVYGMRQILFGLFKKIVIADNCAHFANIIFENSDALNGSALLLGALFFTFQIYGDFSGYSDIAIGTSRLFGFNLMRNFAFPYFSRDIAEFWRRWHISLSTWFRDYLYIPLGGSHGGTWMKLRNTFIIFIVSGFWHGANWTFVVWGALNAVFFIPLLLRSKNRANLNIVAEQSFFPKLSEIRGMLMTFTLTVLAWIFFRAENLSHAFSYLGGIFSYSFFELPNFSEYHDSIFVIYLILLLMVVEWFGRKGQFAIARIDALPGGAFSRFSIYLGLIILIVKFGGEEQNFIYFQF